MVKWESSYNSTRTSQLDFSSNKSTWADGYTGYNGAGGYSGYSGAGLQGYSGYSGYSGYGVSGYSGTSGYSGFSKPSNFTSSSRKPAISSMASNIKRK